MAPTAHRSSQCTSKKASQPVEPPKIEEKDEETQYRLKAQILLEKTDHIVKNNNILRNRLYHVRKEINYLKRLKRVLWQRLIIHGETCFIESELEIPDKPETEGTSNSFDKVMNEVASNPGPAPKRRRGEGKKAAANANKQDDLSSRRVSEIINGIITDVHNERMQKEGQIPPTKAAANSVRIMSPKMEELLLRASSCDKDLPQGPDAE